MELKSTSRTLPIVDKCHVRLTFITQGEQIAGFRQDLLK